jgi:hypothetical protein
MHEYPKDECYTPKWIFDKLRLIYDLDVASANHELITCPAKKRYTIEDNALEQPWHGRIWMNPPFSKVTPWIERFIEHDNGVGLVPLSSNGRWVNRLWDSQVAFCYLPSNLAFVGASGHEVKMRWRVTLIAAGADNIKAMSNLGRVR